MSILSRGLLRPKLAAGVAAGCWASVQRCWRPGSPESRWPGTREARSRPPVKSGQLMCARPRRRQSSHWASGVLASAGSLSPRKQCLQFLYLDVVNYSTEGWGLMICSYEIEQMREKDLPEVVHLEETTGLNRWGYDAYRRELVKNPNSIMLVSRDM